MTMAVSPGCHNLPLNRLQKIWFILVHVKQSQVPFGFHMMAQWCNMINFKLQLRFKLQLHWSLAREKHVLGKTMVYS